MLDDESDNIQTLMSLFKDLKEIFDKNNIEFWLIYGALLGIVREGRLLPWDRDIDIAIWERSLPKIESALKEFHDKRITVHFSESGHVSFNQGNKHISAMMFSNHGDVATRCTFTHMHKFKRTSDGIQLREGVIRLTHTLKYIRWILTNPEFVGDSPQFITRNIQDYLLRFSFSMPNSLRLLLKEIIEHILNIGCDFFIEDVPSKYFDELSEIEFYDLKVKAPFDKEGYLVHKYGTDWRTPKKDYIYYEDAKAEKKVQ